MSFFTKNRKKNLVKKLRKELDDYKGDPKDKSREQSLQKCLTFFSETMNSEEDKKDGIPAYLNEGLYGSGTFDLLLGLMPCFEQTTLNAASTLIQTTIREFPDTSLSQHIQQNPETLTTLLQYFEHPKISNISHTLIRSCANVASFTTFLFENGTVGSFIQYLFGDSFDKISTAFTTYDALITSHLEISGPYISDPKHWPIFQIQFKQLMCSPNYLIKLNFMPILLKFITCKEVHSTIFMPFLADVENLMLSMFLLEAKSKRVQANGYSLFKLFVINPRKTDQIYEVLKGNKTKLLKLLKDMNFDSEDREFEQSRQDLMTRIRNMN